MTALRFEDEHSKLRWPRHQSSVSYSNGGENRGRPVCQVILSSKNVDINSKRNRNDSVDNWNMV